MSRHRTTTVFCSALGASVVVHAALLTWVSHEIEQRRVEAQAQRPEEVAIALPRELKLGLDEPSPELKTWLGDTEPEPQLAPKSESEQAAFTEQPTVTAPETQQINSPPQPQLNEARQAAVDSISQAAAEISKSAEVVVATFDRLQNLLSSALKSTGAPHEKKEHAASKGNNAQPAPHATASQSNPQEQSPIAQAAPSSEPHPGTPREKESVATSIIDIPPDQWRYGKPLAAEGLELQPKRPTLTLLTMLTAAPGNPLCRIRFDRDGVAIEAAILQSSGDRRVDDAILASLYRWRAAGKQLESLIGDELTDVTIRILLTRPRVDQT